MKNLLSKVGIVHFDPFIMVIYGNNTLPLIIFLSHASSMLSPLPQTSSTAAKKIRLKFVTTETYTSKTDISRLFCMHMTPMSFDKHQLNDHLTKLF